VLLDSLTGDRSCRFGLLLYGSPNLLNISDCKRLLCRNSGLALNARSTTGRNTRCSSSLSSCLVEHRVALLQVLGRFGDTDISLLVGGVVEALNASFRANKTVNISTADSLRALRVISSLALANCLCDEGVQERQVEVKVLLGDLLLSQGNSKDKVFAVVGQLVVLLLHDEVVEGSLLHCQVARTRKIVHDLLDIVILFKGKTGVKPCQGKQDTCSRLLLLECAVRELAQKVQNLSYFLGVGLVGAVLAEDPGDDLHQGVGNVWVLFQNLEINFDSGVSELVTNFISLVL